MSEMHLKLDPHEIPKTRDAWWYEAPGGIEVVVEPRDRVIIARIPWRSIRYALARKDK